MEQFADLAGHVGPADLAGGGHGVLEHLAALVGLACGQQQLAQHVARERDPVGPLQAAEDLEGLAEPGGGCLEVLPRKVDAGQVPAGGGDPVEVAELPVDFQPLSLQLGCLVVIAAPEGDERDAAPGDGGFAGVAQPLVHRQLDLAADPQRLVIVPALVGDVGDAAPGEGGFAGVAQPLVHRQLDLVADPQRLVIVAAPVGDVGDAAPGGGGGAGVAQPLEGWQLDLAVDPQRLVIVPALEGDVGDAAPGDGGFAGIAQPLVHRQLDLAADPQRLVVVPALVGDVGDAGPR